MHCISGLGWSNELVSWIT